MTAPDDEDPAIASLLEDAARLATAANEKLGEAMGVTDAPAETPASASLQRGVTRLSMPIANGSNPGRTAAFGPGSPRRSKSRICTPRKLGRQVGRLTGAASFMPWSARLEALYFVLVPPRREPREDARTDVAQRAEGDR